MKEWRQVYFIPQSYVDSTESFGDDYHSKWEGEDEGEGVPDGDDLRITVNLISGHNVLIQADCRMIISGEGISIEALSREITSVPIDGT